MSIISTQSLFPIVALNLGTTVTEDIKDKKVYKLTKHYFAVFCVKTPDRVYFIEGDDKIVIPKLSELIKEPSLHLGKTDCEVPLPPFVVNNFVNFLKDPTIEISGFYLYDLYAHGFITADYFASRIIGLLKPQLEANAITVESIDTTEVIKLAHKAQASKLGLSGDSLTLKDRLKAYVNIDSKPKAIKDVHINGVVTVDTVEVKDPDPDPVAPAVTPDPVAPEIFADDVQVDLTTMRKKDLLSYAGKLGITGVSKNSTVAKLIETITEKLTDPDPDPVAPAVTPDPVAPVAIV